MVSKVQFRRDTAANWSTTNPVLSSGEIGLETNTLRLKVGDGSANWSTEPYFVPEHLFRLTASGSAIGPAIADFFGSSSTITLDPATDYEVDFEIFFLKTTAGTVTFTLTSSQAPVALSAYYIGSAAAGMAATSTSPQTGGIVNSTATAAALPVTASITTATNHAYRIKAVIASNATTASTFKLQVTSSAGTVTPLRGSNYKVRTLPTINSGAFA